MAHQPMSRWREGHPFTVIDGLDIIHNVHGNLFIFAAGLIYLHRSQHRRGAVIEPQLVYGGQAHG